MLTRRRFLQASGLFAVPMAAHAQQAGRVWRIGFLGATSPSGYASQVTAFREGLRGLGYVEGTNLAIEFRWAEGNYARLPELAVELVRLRPDVLVTHAPPGTRAAKRATSTIPIVMGVTGDAVATGLVESLARPGGNVTGSSFFVPEVSAKRLELLKEAAPQVSRVAVLLNPDNPGNGVTLETMERTARSLRLQLHTVEARGPADIDVAVPGAMRRQADGLLVYEDAMLVGQAERVADVARKHRLPSVGFVEYARAGGLLAFGVSYSDLWRRAAVFVDRILKGAKPADLPVEQATKFELAVNLRTAKALGITIPPSLLFRIDQVIE